MDSTFKTRLVEEKDQLVARIRKLMSFVENDLFQELHKDQKQLLVRQLNAMTTYQEILSERFGMLDD
ncbi:MAG: hypothetical protein ACJAW3_001622 [Lentimonas sp.]|jgi:hypothetical protein